jgi:hypothetical protein
VIATGAETFADCWGFANEKSGPEGCWIVVEKDGFEQQGKEPAPNSKRSLTVSRPSRPQLRRII